MGDPPNRPFESSVPFNPVDETPARATSALSRCLNHLGWNEWDAYNANRTPRNRIQLKTWLQQHRQYDTSRLASYLMAGLRGWGRTDWAMGIPCKQARYDALAWRRGGGGLSMKRCQHSITTYSIS